MNSLVSCKHCHILLKNVFCVHLWSFSHDMAAEVWKYYIQKSKCHPIPCRQEEKKKKKSQHCHWILLGLFYIVFHILLRGKLKGQRSLSLSLSVLLNLNLIPHYTRFVLLCVCVQILECLNLCVDCQVYFIYSLCLHFRSPKKEVKFIIVKSVIWWSLYII